MELTFCSDIHFICRLSDTIVLLYNDWLLEQLKVWQLLPGEFREQLTPPTSVIDLDQMNYLASDQMGNLLAPCHWPSWPSKELGDKNEPLHDTQEDELIHSQPLELSHILTALPEARIIRCVSTPTERTPVSRT